MHSIEKWLSKSTQKAKSSFEEWLCAVKFLANIIFCWCKSQCVRDGRSRAKSLSTQDLLYTRSERVERQLQQRAQLHKHAVSKMSFLGSWHFYVVVFVLVLSYTYLTVRLSIKIFLERIFFQIGTWLLCKEKPAMYGGRRRMGQRVLGHHRKKPFISWSAAKP